MTPIPLEWGPQSNGDDTFTRKCRLLQSRYRYTDLKEAYGTGPHKKSKYKYGNMLVNGGITGSNFLSPEIFEYAKFRKKFEKNGETIDEFRLFNNMLGSQTMCFNLFFPLKRLFERNEPAASKVFAACFPALNIKKVLAVEIEYFPYPKDEYLNDQTAFDAMLIFKNTEGKKCILAIETKYSEKLGDNPSADLMPQIKLTKECGLFNEHGQQYAEKGMTQLGRNFLLALKYAEVHHLDMAYAVVISHNGNSSITEIDAFNILMIEEAQNRLFWKSLETFIEKIESTWPEKMKKWTHNFRKRYLDFGPISGYLPGVPLGADAPVLMPMNENANIQAKKGMRTYAQHLAWLERYNIACRAKGLPEAKNKRYKEDPNYVAP